MSEDDVSGRRRSRPVTKHSAAYKIKRNKPALFLAILIVFMLVFSGFYVVFNSLTDSDTNGSTYDTEYPVAEFDTTMGSFAVELYTDKVPITAGNFINHAKDGYYDGIIFHRVMKDFMIQGGDPKGDGTGGYAYEYHEGLGNPDNQETWTIPDEFHEDLSNVRKSISMANTGLANSGGSQFFINVVDNTYLDYKTEPNKHAVFGMVISGMDVVDDISNVETNPSTNKPLTNVVINSITIVNE
jgi:cyclophilin family peptidyl-prolyl cis-trans isomerase